MTVVYTKYSLSLITFLNMYSMIDIFEIQLNKVFDFTESIQCLTD